MLELNVVQGSAEWHSARAKCFTASEAPAMMGVSKYMTRLELLRQKATGVIPEVDAATQARFDMGHAVEAMARSLAEKIIGAELYPVVATDDTGRYLASSDGVASNDGAITFLPIGFEHKAFNEALADQVRQGVVPASHSPQLDHQALVFGFEKILFMVSDGTPDLMAYCWYCPTQEKIDALIAGWAQFNKDLENYQPEELKPAIVPDTIEDLPALTVQLVGQVTASNLETFESVVTARIRAISTELKTDADFVNADKMVKFLGDGEKKLELVKSQALSQTESIDKLFRTIDSLQAEMKAKRLALDKLVKAEKENRKTEIVTGAHQQYRDHWMALCKRVGCEQIPAVAVGYFAEAVKGLKSLDSMRNAVSVALANAKIEANAVADRIDANRAAVEDMSLFPDFTAVCTKLPEDFAALMAMRIAQRQAAEERRAIEAEQQAHQKEANRIAKEIAAKSFVAPIQPAQVVHVQPVEIPPVEQNQAIANVSLIDEGKTIRLGEICAELEFTVTADFLEKLGYRPVRTEKTAKLYSRAQLHGLYSALIQHISNIATGRKRAA